MKKLTFLALAIIAFCGFAFAQNAEDYNIDAPSAEQMGVTSSDVTLKEISIDKFETEGTWKASISSDEGIVASRLFYGAPAGKQPIPDEEGMDIPDDMVLGARVDFYRRGYNSFTVTAAKPLPVEGITKTVSVWVAGRNFNHTLNLLLKDYWGNNFEVYMGKLNHTGWKLMTAAIPPQNPDGRNGIIQKDYHYGDALGVRIVGFRVDCDPDDAYGSYYIYFDDLRAVTDLYDLQSRDEDDMLDNW